MAWLADRGVWAALIVIGTAVVWYVLHRLTEAWISRAAERLRNNVFLGDIAKQEVVLKWLDEAVIALLIGGPAVIGLLDVLGVDMGTPFQRARDWWSNSAGPWLGDKGLTIAVIILIGWVAKKILAAALVNWLSKVIQHATEEEGETPEEAKRRADTLSNVMGGVVGVVIYLVVVMMVLLEVGVSVGPLIGSLGLLGVAVGFGSQWLVRDVIAGAFILGENQFRKGDVVEVAGVSGLVESINLRRTALRDIDGKVHIVPNGEIKVASNFSRKWARMNIDVQVAYKHDMDHVLSVLTELGEHIYREPYWAEVLLEAPKPLGVDKFDNSGITIKVLAMTKPLKNWEVKREMLRRIKVRFDAEGIEIPFPHTTLYWGDGAHPASGDAGSAQSANDLRRRLAANAAAARERMTAMRDLAAAEAVARAERELESAFERLAEKRRAAGQDSGGTGAPPAGGGREDAADDKLSAQDRKDARKLQGADDD
jgi:small conductance mechanosensitive channel